MKKQMASPIGARVYKRHRDLIKKAARKLKVSEGEIVRRAIDAFTTTVLS